MYEKINVKIVTDNTPINWVERAVLVLLKVTASVPQTPANKCTGIAPTTSSAFILGQVSQGIEPIWSNIYVKDIAKIKTTVKNPFLIKLLKEKGMDTPDVWRDIRDRDGSVQHLDFLSENEKDTFKTYSEIDQLVIIYQAANRQNHLDQGQSLNIIVHPDTPTKEINKIHITAWKLGLKSLYYQHSMNAAQKFKQKKECESCEG